MGTERKNHPTNGEKNGTHLHLCLPAFIILLTLFGAISIFVPIPLQLRYWVLVAYFVLALGLWFLEVVTGQRGLVGRRLEPAYEMLGELWDGLKKLRKKIRLPHRERND